MKKVINLVIQSKGGIGKSFAIWNFANFYQNDSKTIFIDLDESTKTSNRLVSLVGNQRISHYSLLDEHQKIERESFLNMLDLFSKANFNRMFIDFGASESEEFLKFIQVDSSVESLSEVCDELELDLQFIIVLAGNDTLNACLNYSLQLTELVKNNFPVQWMFNMGLSGGLETRNIAQNKIKTILNDKHPNVRFIPFGDLGFSTSANDIIQMLTHNRTMNDLTYASRTKFKEVMKEFAKVINEK
jgi:hypothetical protein